MATERVCDHTEFPFRLAAEAGRAASEVVSQDSQHVQGTYFRDELNRQLELLEDRTIALQEQLAHHVALGQPGRVRAVERRLRACVAERREIVDMVDALDRRFEQSGPRSHSRRLLPAVQVLTRLG